MTRNENPNPEIGWASKVPDNHCHKSSRHINLWLEEILQTAKMKDKNSCGKRVPHSGWERMALYIRIIPSVKKDAVTWRLWKETPPATITVMQIYGGLYLYSKRQRGQSQPSNLLGIHAGSAKRISACSSQVMHAPLSMTLSGPSWGEWGLSWGEWGLEEKLVWPQCLFHQNPKLKALVIIFFIYSELVA